MSRNVVFKEHLCPYKKSFKLHIDQEPESDDSPSSDSCTVLDNYFSDLNKGTDAGIS